MGQAFLLRGAKQLLTLRGPNGVRRGPALQNLGVIEDGSVLIRDGIIEEVGSTRRIENLKAARGAIEVPIDGKLVMPGFSDAGLNVSMYHGEEGRKSKKGIDFLDQSIGILRSSLQHGTVAAELKTNGSNGDHFSVLPALRQLKRIGANPVPIRRTWSFELSAQPDEDLAVTLDTLFSNLDTLFSNLARRRLVDYIELDASDQNVTVGARLLGRARQLKLGGKIKWTSGSADALANLLIHGNPRTVTVPSVLDAQAVSVLARVSSILVLSPGQEILEGGKSNNSVRQLIDKGAAVALSTGFDSRHPTSVSMQMAVALAAIRLGLTPEEAISAATINAAWAIGLGHRNGSLEVGKQADLLVMNLSDYRDLPRQFGINHAAMVIREGNIVFNRTKWRFGTV